MSEIDDLIKQYGGDKPTEIKINDNNVDDLIAKYSKEQPVQETPIVSSLNKKEDGFDLLSAPIDVIKKAWSAQKEVNKIPTENPLKGNPVYDTVAKYKKEILPYVFLPAGHIIYGINKLAGDSQPPANDYLRAVTEGYPAGVGESMPAKMDDPYYDPNRKKYKLSVNSWNINALKDKDHRVKVLRDLSFITGKTLYDMAPMIAIGLTTGGAGLGGAAGSLASMSAYGGASSALEQNRDTGRIDPKQVGKDALVTGVAGLGGNIAGASTKGAVKLMQLGANRIVDPATKTGAVVSALNKPVNVISSLAGVTAETGAQAYIPAKMEGRDLTKEDMINAIPSTILAEAGMKGVKLGKAATVDRITERVPDTLDSAIGEHVPHVTTQENAVDIINKIDQKRAEGVPENDIGYNLAVDEIVNVHNAREVGLKSGKKTPIKKFFNDPVKIAEVLTDKVKEIEHQTGRPTGLLDDKGTIRDIYVGTNKQIKDWMHDYEKGTGDFANKDIDMSDWATYNIYESLNKRYIDLSGDSKKGLQKIQEKHGIDLKKEYRLLSSLHGESKRIKTFGNVLDKDTFHSDEHKAVLKDFSDVSPDQMQKLAESANYSKLSPIEKFTQYFTNTPEFYRKKLGETASRFFVEPIRISNMKLMDNLDKMYARVGDAVKDLSKQEAKEVVLSKIAKQINSSGKNVGLRTIRSMVDNGKIRLSEVKDYNNLNEKQKRLYDFISDEMVGALERENDVLVSQGKRAEKGLGKDYIPMKNQYELLAMDQNDPMDIKTNPSFISSLLLNRKGTKFGERRTGGVVDVSLDPAEILTSHLERSYRKTDTAFVADKALQFADLLKAKGNEDIANHLKRALGYWSGNYIDVTCPSWARGIINRANNNVNSSILSWGINTILSNSLTFNNTAAMFGSERVYKAYEEVCRAYVEGGDTPKDISPHVFARLVTPRSTKSVMAHNNNYVYRGVSAFKKGGLTTMEFMDHLNAEVAFQCAYDYYYKEQGFKQREAIYKAGEFVNISQGSADRIDVAPIHRGALGKLFLSFTTFPLSNLNFLVSRAYGLNSGMQNQGSYSSKEEAENKAGSNGRTVETIDTEGNRKYVAYEKIKEVSGADAIKRALYFTIFNTVVNVLMERQEEKTNIRLSPGGANPLSPIARGITGHRLEDYGSDILLGTHTTRKRDRRKAGERIVSTILETAQESSKDVLVLNPLLNYGRAEGSTIGAVNKIGADFATMVKKPTGRKAVKMANDVTVLFGAPTYRMIDYALKVTDDRKHK